MKAAQKPGRFKPTSGPDEPALLIGEADLVRGSTRDVDA
jgi:hypothetical protein